MTAKAEPLVHQEVLAELWENLLDGPRRALCSMVYLDPKLGEQYDWSKIPIDQRVRLVRAMRVLSEVAVDCAIALERASRALEAPSAGRH